MFKRTFDLAKYGMLIPFFAFFHSLNAQIIMTNLNAGIKLDAKGNKYFVEEFSHGLALVSKGGYYGLVDSSGDILIPLKYESVVRVSDHVYIVQMQQKYGIVDEKGNSVTDMKFDDLYNFGGGIAYGKFGCKKYWGINGHTRERSISYSNCSSCFVDRMGKEFLFLDSQAQNELMGPMVIDYDNKCWFIDSNGFKFGWENAYFPGENINLYDKQKIAITAFHGKKKRPVYGWVNSQGNKIFTAFERIESFYNGFALVYAKGKYGAINRWGELVIPIRYKYLDNLEFSLTRAFLKEAYIFIDTTGTEIISLSNLGYNSCGSFKEGLASVQKNNKWGFIDHTGKEIISLQYDSASDFHNGICLVKHNGLYGFIDKNGDEPISVIYNKVNEFDQGLARVRLNDKYGFIDQKGQVVVEIIYEDALHFQEGLVAVMVGGKYGFVDKTGMMVIQPQFHSVERGGFVRGMVQADGDMFNKNGEKIPIR